MRYGTGPLAGLKGGAMCATEWMTAMVTQLPNGWKVLLDRQLGDSLITPGEGEAHRAPELVLSDGLHYVLTEGVEGARNMQTGYNWCEFSVVPGFNAERVLCHMLDKLCEAHDVTRLWVERVS